MTEAVFMATPQMDIALAILRFCPWRERTAVLQLNRAWAGDVRARSWKAFALELEERYQLYVPHQWSERTTAEWRALFLQIFPSAHVWNAVSSDALVPPATHKVTMRVVARFRPKRLRPVDEEAAATVETRVTLPLHQRLQLIKASHGCSSYQAQKLLWAGSDAGHENDPFAAPKGESEARALAPPGTVALVDVTNNSAAGSDEPLEGASLPAVAAPAMTTKAGVVAVNGGEASVVFCAPSIGLREFRFSAAFEARAEQEAVYERSLRPLVIDVLNGRSGCLLCFGQTGSGKTFTMSGPDEASATSLGSAAALPAGKARGAPPVLSPASGLVPRALRELLDAREARAARQRLACEMRISFVEVFADDVTDLLHEEGAEGHARIGAWRGVAARALAEGRADVVVRSAEHATELLLRAERAKRRAATAMNERSSRAHSVLTISLVQTDAEGRQVRSTLCLADLGGSEQLKRSKAQGERLREAVQINLGLLALKNCVAALTSGASYVPYQNSKLTMLLQPGLSGRAQTVVVICASPEAEDAPETVEALRFGELCAVVESSAKLPSASLMAATLRALEEEIGRVEAAIVAKERWEVEVEHRVDERAALDQSGHDQARVQERVLKTKLVGAEAERAQLEELLERRRELLGEDAH